jgi:hypothetical protein
MSLHRVFDAAYPPEQAPPGCGSVLGYIGGDRATHVWTPAEWRQFASLRQFPAYVPNFATQDPAEAAADACQRMRDLGWAPFMAPGRRALVCDLETLQERAWYQVFAAHVMNAGFEAVAYGSESTIFETAAADVIVAGWDGNAQLVPGQTVHGHQYQANVAFGGTTVDFSVVDDWLWARGGVGPRHGAAA